MAYERTGLSLLLGCLLCGCTAAPKPAALKPPTSEERDALMMRVIVCENQAANRYDDGNSTISSLAHQIMMICQPEIIKLHAAIAASPRPFHIPFDDPEWDLHEFDSAVDIVESARKSRATR